MIFEIEFRLDSGRKLAGLSGLFLPFGSGVTESDLNLTENSPLANDSCASLVMIGATTAENDLSSDVGRKSTYDYFAGKEDSSFSTSS